MFPTHEKKPQPALQSWGSTFREDSTFPSLLLILTVGVVGF